jgi:Phage integrase, N-terminal SAM-like domain
MADLAEQWLQDRVLKVRTAELYRGLLRNHLLPAFRDVRLSEMDETAVRRWRKERLDTGSREQRTFGPVTVAKAYRLLHAIFETAVDDQMVRRNPCRIDCAGKDAGRGYRGEPQGAYGAAGAFEHARCDDLPARDQGP